MNRNANTKVFTRSLFKTGVNNCLKKKEFLIGHGKLLFKRLLSPTGII